MNGSIEQSVERHYRNASIENAILDGLKAAGKDPDRLTVDDLAPVDEFHIGGREATADIGLAMNITAGQHLLDVGCGIGGPARYFAKHFHAHVTGIDLTRDFVIAAEALSKRLGLEGRVSFQVGSALNLPFPNASFDDAYIFHVGMNISDKVRLFAEIGRVIKPGGIFGVYEVMRTGAGELAYPVPWAANPDTSFLATPDRYRSMLQGAGFRILSERNRRDFALEFFAAMKARAANPVGLPILMGPGAPMKIGNMVRNIEAGTIAPVEMICRAAAG